MFGSLKLIADYLLCIFFPVQKQLVIKSNFKLICDTAYLNSYCIYIRTVKHSKHNSFFTCRF